MNYQETLDYLYSYIDPSRSGPLPDPSMNLRRTEALLAAFGNPQRALRFVVVAGTKGKGSTCAMIESIARAAGLRTGLWTSPHLHSYRERIQVDRQLIPEADLIRLVESSREEIERVARGPFGPPSTFAIGTALALRYFAEQKVDLAVVEVGLGGRYDSANVLTPLVSVITSISYDHMEFLGQTLAAIAWEKAGILKPGVPAVTIRQRYEAQVVIKQVAQEVGAPLFIADAPEVVQQIPGAESIKTALVGTFQRENRDLAIAAALQLRAAGVSIDFQAIRDGLARVAWPARFEIVPGIDQAATVVIDGAHNGDSARRLLETLHEQFPRRRLVLVFGASRDKDLARILPEFSQGIGAWVLTRSGHPRAMEDLGLLRDRILAEHIEAEVTIEPDPSQAILYAKDLAGTQGVVCVTGSLFVAAAAREALGLAEACDPPKA